jgi:hypothetical protein
VIDGDRDPDGDDRMAPRLAALRDELVRPPSASARWNHLAAMRRARAQAPAETTRQTRRPVRALLVAAAAGVVVLGTTGGLAAAGSLPGPIQDTAATIAGAVGWDLPRADDPAPAGREQSPGSTPAATTKDDAPGPARPGEPGAPTEAPGRSGEAPGQTGETPGQSGTTPGQSGTTPGRSGTAPGKNGTPPSTVPATPAAPGGGGPASGRSGEAPGTTGSTPGQSGETPAGGAEPPGQSGSAPGRSGAVPGPAAPTTPGQGAS